MLLPTMRPPPIPAVTPPGVVPGVRRVDYQSLLGKPTTTNVGTLVGDPAATRKFARSLSSVVAWDTLVPADVTGDVAATRKFLRSLGTGVAPGTTVWDTITSADVSDATAAATANKVVKRDGSGDFAAHVVTADLSGTATNALNVTGGAGSVDTNTGHFHSTVQIDGQLTMNADIQLANTFVAGAPAATGYLIMKDAGGTPYKFLVG